MSKYLPAGLARLVRERARLACEYCLLPQSLQEATIHLDHVRPRADQGSTDADNLAFACVTCSLRKAARTSARDPKTKLLVRLFNPRKDDWERHFRWTRSWRLVGRTPTGRATARALAMNRPAVLKIRRMLARLGEHQGRDQR